MKKITTLLLGLCITAFSAAGQTADEIIANYFESTGGYENWGQLKGLKITGKLNQQGMELPVEIVQLASGKQYFKINVQGQDLYQGVFDGTTLWSNNFQTMKAEKVDDENLQNFKLNLNDFPDAFYDYKKKGYTVELLGKETVEGTETFKIKLVREPLTVDGQKVEDISFFYFESENFVPIVMENEMQSGPLKGQIRQVVFSDYQEVEGMYFPFSMTEGIKDGPSQPIIIEAIELNPEVDETVFAFPEGN